MELKSVSKYFDRTHMWDAYTGQKLKARCQVTVWDAPRRDGLTTIRRTLSLAYGAQLPERHAIVFGGSAWIVSSLPNPDTFGLDTVRVGYVAQQAYLGRMGTTADVLNDTGEEVYLSRVWVKDIKDIVNASEVQSRVYIYFVYGEPVQIGQFLWVNHTWHICLNIIQGTAGLMIAECNEMAQSCVVSVELLGQGQYNPVTEQFEQDGAQTVNAVLLDWRDDYIHAMASVQTEEVGDMRLRFAPDDTEKVSLEHTLRFKDYDWRIISLTPRRDGSVSASIRRV